MLTQQALDLIKEFEGYRSKSYRDSGGVWTIGYGTITYPSGEQVKSGETINKRDAEKFLRGHAEKDAKAVEKETAYLNLNQDQKDALVSFRYNIGSLRQLTANGTRSIEEIARAIPKYNKAGGRFIQGLQNRRDKELEVFLSGKPEESSEDSSRTSGASLIDTTPIEQPKEPSSFGEAFKAARKRLGSGQEFSWNGKRYSTNYAEEQNFADGGVVRFAPKKPPMFLADGGLVYANTGKSIWNNAKGEEINVSDWITDKTGIETPGLEKGALGNTPGWDNIKGLVDFIPVVGDIKGIYDLAQAIQASPRDAALIAAGTVGVLVGLFPGPAGDLAKKAIEPVIYAAVKAGKFLPSDVLGILRAIKDRDWEFLKGWGVPEEVTTSVGAKVAKELTFYVRNADGSVSEHLMTPAEFAEFIGKSPSATKKANGKTADGLPWAKNPEDLKELSGRKKTESLIATAEFIDPMTVERTKGARMSWKGISEAERAAIEGDITSVLIKNSDEKADELGLVIDDDGLFDDQHTTYTDWKRNAEFAEEIAEESWPEIVQNLEKYKEKLGAAQWNKLVVWSKNKSHQLFSNTFENRITQGARAGFDITPSRKIDIFAEEGTLPDYFKDFPVDVKKALVNSRVVDTLAQYNDGTGAKFYLEQSLAKFRNKSMIIDIVTENADGTWNVPQGLLIGKGMSRSDGPGYVSDAMKAKPFREAYDKITKDLGLQTADDVFPTRAPKNNLIATDDVDQGLLDDVNKATTQEFDDYGGPEVGQKFEQDQIDEFYEDLDGNYPIEPHGLFAVRSMYSAEPKGSRKFLDRITANYEPEEVRLGWMQEPELAALGKLPQKFKVYRLQNDGPIDGWSWTIDKSWVEGTMREGLEKTGGPGRVVYSAEIDKDDVYGFFQDIGESEIIIKPGDVKNVQRTGYNRGGPVLNMANGGCVRRPKAMFDGGLVCA